MGEKWKLSDFIFLGSKITVDSDCSQIKRFLLLGGKTMTNLDGILNSRDITLMTKVHIAKDTIFPVVMYGCESWTVKKAECWKTGAFELQCWRRLFESPLDSKEIKPVNPKGNQLWILIGRTDAEAKTPIVGPHDVNSQLVGKDPDAGKDWRQKEKRAAEEEMVGWHHQFNGHELGQTWEMVREREAWCATGQGVSWSQHDLAIEKATF